MIENDRKRKREKEREIEIQIDVIHETARVPIGCIVHFFECQREKMNFWQVFSFKWRSCVSSERERD